MTAIIYALRQGNRALALTYIAKALPYQVCQSDINGQTPLHIAVQKNYLDVIKALLEKGAKLNTYANDPAHTHMTPLHYSALTGNLAATRLLLAWGADTKLKNTHQQTAAVIAYQHGFLEVAKTIERFEKMRAKYQWPKITPHIQHKTVELSFSRRLLELQNSSIESLYARTWICQHSKPANNVVNLTDYRKKRGK